MVSKTSDRVILYKADGENYIDIFKGLPEDIPNNILEMEIFVFGSIKKGVLDMQIKEVRS